MIREENDTKLGLSIERERARGASRRSQFFRDSLSQK
jgi:hypothetical protein